MFIRRIILLELIVLGGVFFFPLKAQYPHLQLHLSPGKKKLSLKTFPFSRVIVLDNRYDTGRLKTALTTDYSHRYITLDTSAVVAVREYIGTVTAPATKGDKTLLINIKVMGVPNRNTILFKGTGRILNSGDDMREKLLLQADAYYSTGDGSFRKILSMAGMRRYYNDSLTRALGDLLNVLIQRVSDAGLSSAGYSPRGKDSRSPYASITYARDTTTLTIGQIDIPALRRWAGYPIMHVSDAPRILSAAIRTPGNASGNTSGNATATPGNASAAPGDSSAAFFGPDSVFGYSSDLRDDTPKADDSVRLAYDPKDSVYRLTKGGHGQSFAVHRKDGLFIQIYQDIYVRLYRDKDRLRFYVPRSLPDMYALLCLEIVQNTRAQTVTTGSFLGNLAGGMMLSAMQDGRTNRAVKGVTSAGLQNDYRHGIVDIETGDILYSDVPPPEPPLPPR